MTEYDNSPAAYASYQRTQRRIANWADDTAQCAPQYKSPFVPRSDVPSNAFYNPKPRSASSSRSPTHTPSPPPGHGHSHHRTNVRSPLRSHTIAVDRDIVSPRDSISQVSAPTHSHRSRRTQSHSPTRHNASSRSRSHRSGHGHGGTTYIVSPGGVQYAQPQPMQYSAQPQPMQYAQPQPQPAAYVVYPGRDRKVQIIYPQVQYPPAPHPSQEHHSGGLLQRLFGSQSGKHGHSRSRSLSTGGSRDSSRSRR
ncbi:hypothetical protein B0H19DRAFT_1062265 [Mycena capillaripes]|nr:hypothetical protein B0H19DRAFT_1062265 [Mycena capillaripes]